MKLLARRKKKEKKRKKKKEIMATPFRLGKAAGRNKYQTFRKSWESTNTAVSP